MTLTRLGLPTVEIALGAIKFPIVQSTYQQLHNYPVGATGKERAEDTKGTKYNIQPVRREFLSEVDGYICLRGNSNLEGEVIVGLREGARYSRGGNVQYGIPFLGDNNFMVDVLKEETRPRPAYWYTKLKEESLEAPEGRCRLTVWIDRANMTRTVAHLYVPTKESTAAIPEEAWTCIAPPSITPASKRGT
jgi:CRISPR-associated protein Cas5t